MTVDQLNAAPAEIARQALYDCCGSTAWVDRMTKARPYQDLPNVQQCGEKLWWSLNEFDWLEAFAAHPKIGEKKSSMKWSAAEQSGMSEASEATASFIASMNEDYERKFGWIFIVCATGKSASEMQRILQGRLQNSRESELRIAAAEQIKITNLRLEKLVAE
jgi:2-oxo-4-hydroxy-4-carboxy-5-ureidoimidazoline decarboxylase